MEYVAYNGQLALIPFFLYFMALLRYRRYLRLRTKKGIRGGYFILLVWLVLSSVFAFQEHDTYHYWEGFELLKNGGSYFEDFYKEVAAISPSYFWWRFIVWGLSSILVLFTARLLELKSSILGFVFPLFFVTQFDITRGALGLSLCVFSLVVFYKSLSKNYPLALKIVLIFLSLYGIIASLDLHRSISIFAILIPISYFLPLNRKFLICSIVAFPIIYVSAGYLFGIFTTIGLLREQQDFMVNYNQIESIKLSIFGVLRIFLERLPWVVLVYCIAFKFCKEKNVVIKNLFKYAFLLVYLSTVLLYQTSLGPWLSIRSIHASSFPLVFCAAYYYQFYKLKKIDKLVILLFVITVSYYHFIFNILNWW